MGQTTCNACSSKQEEKIVASLYNEGNDQNKHKTLNFDGNLFNKESKKIVYRDQNSACLIIQSYFKAYAFRKFFNQKLRQKLKNETIILIEMTKDNLTPQIISELKKNLKDLDLDTYYEANNSYSISFCNGLNKNKIIGSYLILYKYNSKSKINNKSNHLHRTYTKFTIAKSLTNSSSNGSTSNTESNYNLNYYEDYTSYYYGEVNINNEKNGYGEYLSENKTFYKGYWVKNKFEGFGVVIDAKGFVYEGMLFFIF